MYTPLYYRRVWGRMDTCICMTEPLCFSPETITTLLTGYTPMQIKSQKQKRVQRATQPSFCHTKIQEVSTLRPGRRRSPEPDSSDTMTSCLGFQKSVSHSSFLTVCDPIDCSPPDSSVHGIFQARILECLAISFSRGLPDPGIEPRSPALQAGFFFSMPNYSLLLAMFLLSKNGLNSGPAVKFPL